MAKTTKSSTKQTSMVAKNKPKSGQKRPVRVPTSQKVMSASTVKTPTKRIIPMKISKPNSPEDAIAMARFYLIKLLNLTEEPILEEIEINKDKHWYITFSISDPARANFSLLPLIPRKYKTIKIDANSGVLVSITMHDGKK